MNPTIIIRFIPYSRSSWYGLTFWLVKDKSLAWMDSRSKVIEAACNNLPNAKFDDDTATSYPQDVYHQPRPVSLTYPVMVDSGGQCWAVDEAVSVQAAHNAIAMAQCSGAIGTTESELTGPNTRRILARVHRLDEHGHRVRAR